MGISRAQVYNLIKAGELPYYKDGSRTLILVANIEARIERLSRISKSGPPTPLLPPADRKLARGKVRVLEEPTSAPLLPVEQQQLAVELTSEPEPSPSTDLLQPSAEPESPSPESLDSPPAELASAGWRAKI